jgi:hypothetical protein
VNPNSLKGPGRRVLPRLARADRASHDRGKLPVVRRGSTPVRQQSLLQLL